MNFMAQEFETYPYPTHPYPIPLSLNLMGDGVATSRRSRHAFIGSTGESSSSACFALLLLDDCLQRDVVWCSLAGCQNHQRNPNCDALLPGFSL